MFHVKLKYVKYLNYMVANRKVGWCWIKLDIVLSRKTRLRRLCSSDANVIIMNTVEINVSGVTQGISWIFDGLQ